jgi:hypothetical protein
MPPSEDVNDRVRIAHLDMDSARRHARENCSVLQVRIGFVEKEPSSSHVPYKFQDQSSWERVNELGKNVVPV